MSAEIQPCLTVPAPQANSAAGAQARRRAPWRHAAAWLVAAAMALPLPAFASVCAGTNLIAAQSPETRARMAAAIDAIPYPEGNLWAAEAADGTRITIVGTMHLADPRHAPLLETVLPLLGAADLLVVEATARTEADLQLRLLSEPALVYIQQGPDLLQQLGPDYGPRLRDQLAERGIPGFLAAKFQPWYAALTLAIPGCILGDLAAAAGGLDKLLIRSAAAAGVPVAALDDVDGLLRLLTDGTAEEQLDTLRLSLRLGLTSTDMVSTMFDSYFAGRHRESWEFWHHIDLGLPEDDRLLLEAEMARMERLLLQGRNLDWIDRITRLTQGRTAVLAVGAAHLSDWHGVLNQLAERGFVLSRLDG